MLGSAPSTGDRHHRVFIRVDPRALRLPGISLLHVPSLAVRILHSSKLLQQTTGLFLTRPLPGQAPLVGRTSELKQLAMLVDRLAAGEGWFATIAGGAGVGKSRLVGEVTTAAWARGMHVLVGYCDEDTRQDPYGPYIEALRRGLGDADPAVRADVLAALPRSLHPLLPDLSDDHTDVSSLDRTLVADGLRRVLEAFGTRGGAIVVVEDLHLATRATLAVLRQLAREVERISCGLIATWRTDDSESEGALRSFETNSQTRASMTARIELRPLTWSEARQFVGVLLGATALPPTSFIDQLYERTEGNPFYIEELVHAMEPGDDGRDYSALAEGLPATLGGVLRQRLERVGARGERVLGAAAVFGRRFSAEALIEVAGLDAATVERSLEYALRHDIVAEVDRGFLFRHALLQEAAMARLLGPERRRLHLRIAHALERDPAAAVGRSAALAYHYGRADDRESQRLYAERAGDEAIARNDPREATTWYADALRLAGEVSEDEPIALLEKAARVFVRNWRLGDAEWAYGRLIAARREAGDSKALGETLAASAMVFFNDPPRRLERLHQALEVLEPLGKSVSLARAKAHVASVYLNIDHPDALNAALSACAVAKAADTPDAEAIALRVIGTLVAQVDIELGARLLRASTREATRLGMNADAYLSSFNLAGAYVRAGRWAEAEAALQPSYQAAVRQNVPDAIGTSLIRFAEIKRLSGDWLAADELLAQARLRIDETDVSARMLFAFEAAYLDAGRGSWDSVLRAVEPMCSRIDEKDQKLDIAMARHLLALARFGAGDVEGAASEVQRMLGALSMVATYAGVPFLRTACDVLAAAGRIADIRLVISDLHSLNESLQVMLDPERVRGLLPDVYGTARSERPTKPAHNLGTMADAVLHSCEAVVAESQRRPADAVAGWQASLTFWERSGRPYDEAACRMRLGAALLLRMRDGDRDTARQHLTAALAAFTRLGAIEARAAEALVRKHRLVAPPSRRTSDELSPRELEVLMLVARGRANREIAQELVLSTRTVDHHVSRLLSKLGLTSRAALATYAAEHGYLMPTVATRIPPRD